MGIGRWGGCYRFLSPSHRRGSDVDEITIDPSANWTPVDKPKDSGKDDEADSPPQKKVKLDTSAPGTPSTAAGGTGGGSVGTPRGAAASSGGGAGGSGSSATGAAAGTSGTAGDSTAAMQQKTGAAAANCNGVPLSQVRVDRSVSETEVG